MNRVYVKWKKHKEMDFDYPETFDDFKRKIKHTRLNKYNKYETQNEKPQTYKKP